jgi:nucleoside phosphorylase
MGKSAASIAAHRALDLYEIGVFVILGIAGALEDDTKVGDVCVSETTIDVLDKSPGCVRTRPE